MDVGERRVRLQDQLKPSATILRHRRSAMYQCEFWVVSQFEIRVSTQSGPDESAQSVGRVTRLSRNIRQPDRVLANEIARHKAKRRPGAGEEWLAAAKYDGAEVESILINKTKVG